MSSGAVATCTPATSHTWRRSGTVKITDRIKDVIKSGGEWISSLELENIASQCPGVSEVAAIGITDERWGERPLLIVVRTPGP